MKFHVEFHVTFHVKRVVVVKDGWENSVASAVASAAKTIGQVEVRQSETLEVMLRHSNGF